MNQESIKQVDSLLTQAQKILRGEPVPGDLNNEVAQSWNTGGYRDDGFSKNTTENGARSHLAVDQALADLRAQGKDDIADEADQFFVFREEDAPDLVAETQRKVEIARYAIDRNMVQWERASQPAILHTTFKKELAIPNPAMNRHFELVDGHAAVFLGQRFEMFKGWRPVTASEAMERYARLLSRHLD